MRLRGKSCKRKIEGETAGPETGLELGVGVGEGRRLWEHGGQRPLGAGAA